MIGGIFETIGKTLGIGKEKYFLELDDAAEKGVENLKATVETVKEVSGDVVGKVQSATDEATDKAKSAAKKGKTKAKATVADAKKSAATDKKAVKNKDKKVAAKGADQSAQKSDQPENGAAPAEAKPSTQSEPRSAEEIIVSAIAAASKKTDDQGNTVDEGPTNFATDYLMPDSNGSRRRPGPSFASFKGMAKEVNPRLKG